MGGELQAQVFGNSTKRTKESGRSIVSDSMVGLQGNIGPDIKWLMFSITKGSFKEVITIPVAGGYYRSNVSLRDGSGLYSIQIFQNNKQERYTSYSYLSATEVENTDERDMAFLLPSPMVQSDAPEIIEVVNTITKNAANESEAVKQIHDYVANTVSYDYDSYYDGSYVSKAYDAVAILKRPLTVCSGYSNLFAAMVRAYGIKAKVVHGKGVVRGGLEDHAWNEVFIDGEWKVVDVTWNSNLKKDKYFFMDEDQFNLDHQKEKEMAHY